MWFPNRSDTNRLVQAQKRARSLKFRISVEEELYYPSRKNKGADQLHSYCEADLRLCFRYADCWFSHEAAHLGHKLLMLMELFPSSKNNVGTYMKQGA